MQPSETIILKAPLAKLSLVVPPDSSLDNLSNCDTKHTSFVTINDKQLSSKNSDLCNPVKADLVNGNTNQSNEDGLEPKSKIPDGGWGWIVVLAALVIALVADGTSFSFGLLHIKFVKQFKASNSVTSWIGSLFMAVPLLTGPIMSALVDKYGCRSMTILGGIISTVGFILSAFANSITIMYITFGVLAGLGLGLCFVTSVVAIAFWFEKKRNFAVGLGACGTGIGTFVYAPLTSFLLQEYGWRGTVILLAGTFLNICVCGAVMRDPDWIIEQDKLNEKLSKSSKSSSLTINSSNTLSIIDLREIKKMLGDGKDAEYVLQMLTTSVTDEMTITAENVPKKLFSSVLNLPTFVNENEKVPLEVLEKLCSNKRLYKIILENYPSLLHCRSTSEQGFHNLTENSVIDRIPVKLSVKVKKAVKTSKSDQHRISIPEEGKEQNEPLLTVENRQLQAVQTKKTTFADSTKADNSMYPVHAYFRNMKLHALGMSHHGTPFNAYKYKIRASSCPNIYKVSMTTLAKHHREKWYTEIMELFEGMLDFSLFRELHFLILSLSTIILFTWFVVPYFYLVDHMQEYNYSETQASFILSIIGVSNTIGMVVLGWAGDQPWLNVTKTCAVCLIICGLSLAGMMVFTSSYILVAICAAIFGLTLASSFSYTPVMIVELVSLDRFTTGYGLSLLCQGVGNLVGPPLAGFLKDSTNNWNWSFYIGAVWVIISGIMLGIIPYTKNRVMFSSDPLQKDSTN